jgi:hypothetical protein
VKEDATALGSEPLDEPVKARRNASNGVAAEKEGERIGTIGGIGGSDKRTWD